MRRAFAPSVVLFSLLAAAPAHADEPAVRSTFTPPPRIGAVLVGARVGALFPQPFDNRLGTSFLVEVGAAYQLPLLARRLGVTFDVGYTQPGVTTTAHYPNVAVNGGNVERTLTQRDLGFTLGAQFMQPIKERFLVWAGAGAKLHLTQNVVTSRAGSEDLGENSESSTRIGFVGRAGGGYRVGPGAVVLQLQVDYAPVAQLTSGESNTANLSLALGYTLFLL